MKVILAGILVLIVAPAVISAENEQLKVLKNPEQLISIAPFDFGGLGFSVEYQEKTSERTSGAATIAFGNRDYKIYDAGTWRWSVVGGAYTWRSFFILTSPEGWHWTLGLNAMVISSAEFVSVSSGTVTAKGSGLLYGPTAGIGYTTLFGPSKQFSFHIGFEAIYNLGHIAYNYAEFPLEHGSFAVPLTLGYAW